jgi:hypothetical protein
MDTQVVLKHFAVMGARVLVHPPSRPRFWSPVRPPPGPVAVDVRRDRKGEYFDIALDAHVADIDVLDVQPKSRHLLLLARLDDGRRKDKFLCGHDERSWFVAAVPDERGVSNVRTAFEALKPAPVRVAQNRTRVRFRDRTRRRTEAYVRQGEWFFLPAPGLVVKPVLVLQNEPLRRGAGKPHMCAELYREGGTTVYVCLRHPNGLNERAYRQLLHSTPSAQSWGWRVMRRDPRVYVRGRVWHADHKTVVLPFWHQVQMNTETQSQAMRNVAFLD